MFLSTSVFVLLHLPCTYFANYVSGKCYLKLGHFRCMLSETLHSSQEVKELYVNGRKTIAEKTVNFIRSLLKGKRGYQFRQKP